MSSTVEKLEPTRAKITISVTPEEFKPTLDNAYKEIAKNVDIPGFRKGHVPARLIDQRFGKAVVMEQAINDNLDNYYQAALQEHNVLPLGRPNADIAELPNPDSLAGDVKIVIEVDVAPEFDLPKLDGLQIEVDKAEVSDADIDKELDRLRDRFATLTKVDRPAKKGDFTTVDLKASVDGEVVDDAEGISYEIGSGQLLEGTDEALTDLTAGESTSFESKLLGGDHEGETALIEITLQAVKERELPAVDDDFAQLASEFDTVAELRESLKGEAAKRKASEQFGQARGKAVEALLAAVDIPLPEGVVTDEVKAHLEQEGKAEDDPHAKEVRPDVERGLRTQLLLDKVSEELKIEVSPDELSQYMMQQAMQYGIEPNQLIQILAQQGQLPALYGEITRNKTISTLVSKAEVKDTDSNAVDFSEFLPKEKADDAEAAVADSTDDAAADEKSADGHSEDK